MINIVVDYDNIISSKVLELLSITEYKLVNYSKLIFLMFKYYNSTNNK
jgi:hypothetical protein